ncbi:MAG TPA: hypothetical protein DCQ90_03420 [Erysipelotrichaceae bacterium]|nr:hypothetical protein [Erysipelotrichaceae bacterium]
MIIYCTKKLADKLETPVEVIENEASFFNWSANLIKHGRKQILLLSHSDSKYPVLVAGILKKDIKHLGRVIHEAIAIQLEYEKVKPEIIQRFLDDGQDVRFAKLSDRKMVGGLIRWDQELLYRYDLRDVDNGPLPEVSVALARVLVTIHKKNYEYPSDVFFESFASAYGAQLFESRGIRLKFTLKMKKTKVWRIITCPLPISYKHLHHIIVESFGWYGSKPHMFKVIDKRTKSIDTIVPYFPETEEEFFENSVQATDFDFTQYDIHYYYDPAHTAIIEITSFGWVDKFDKNQPWCEETVGVANPDGISPEEFEELIELGTEELDPSARYFLKHQFESAERYAKIDLINRRLSDVIQTRPDTFV